MPQPNRALASPSAETLTLLFTAPGKGIDYRGLPPIISGIEVIEEEESTSSASR